MRPLIGIPPCLDERGRWRSGRDYHYIDADYARAVDDAGGVAVYLPPREDAGELAARLDGLLIPGGDDLPPPRPYPEGVHFEIVPARQLAFDGRLLDAALARRIPVLGICYGMQLIALHHGGELIYDIASDVADACRHRLPEPDGRHGVAIEDGSALDRAVGPDPGPVNSTHHQAVSRPGEGLRVCARSQDGLVEAIEGGGSFCVGVQWHPEKLSGGHRDGLFGAFVSACGARG